MAGGKKKAGDNKKDAEAPKGGGAGGGKPVKGAQSIFVRHILVDKHAQREQILEKLREGAAFDALAREFSQDKARQGGDLGQKTKGTLDPDFEAVAYGLPASEDREFAGDKMKNYPYGLAKTAEGYHIILVYKRK